MELALLLALMQLIVTKPQLKQSNKAYDSNGEFRWPGQHLSAILGNINPHV